MCPSSNQGAKLTESTSVHLLTERRFSIPFLRSFLRTTRQQLLYRKLFKRTYSSPTWMLTREGKFMGEKKYARFAVHCDLLRHVLALSYVFIIIVTSLMPCLWQRRRLVKSSFSKVGGAVHHCCSISAHYSLNLFVLRWRRRQFLCNWPRRGGCKLILQATRPFQFLVIPAHGGVLIIPSYIITCNYYSTQCIQCSGVSVHYGPSSLTLTLWNAWHSSIHLTEYTLWVVLLILKSCNHNGDVRSYRVLGQM